MKTLHSIDKEYTGLTPFQKACAEVHRIGGYTRFRQIDENVFAYYYGTYDIASRLNIQTWAMYWEQGDEKPEFNPAWLIE